MNICIYIYIYLYIYICIYIYIHIYIYIYVYIYIYTYVYIYVCVYKFCCLLMYVCICTPYQCPWRAWTPIDVCIYNMHATYIRQTWYILYVCVVHIQLIFVYIYAIYTQDIFDIYDVFCYHTSSIQNVYIRHVWYMSAYPACCCSGPVSADLLVYMEDDRRVYN